VEAQDLNPARVRTPRQDARERVDRAPRQRRVGVRLDVDLHHEPGRDEVEQLIDEQGSLGGRLPLAVKQPPREHIGGSPLVRPPSERGRERQVGVVQAGQRAVAREAYVGLDAAKRAACERRPQRPPGGVRPVAAPAAVRDQRISISTQFRSITRSGVSRDGDRLVTRP
jgi:hypothetical protein